MAGLRTEFGFVLPKGLVEPSGTMHREGTMRLATARDELEPLNDPKVRDADDPYLTVIVLSRVITRLGTRSTLSPRDIEGLFAADLAYLQDVYAAINYGTEQDIERTLAGPAAAPPAPTRPQPAALGALTRDPAPPGAATPAPQPATDPPDDHDDTVVDDDGMELPTPSRRARIEEVGRSTGRPGGA